MHLSLTFLFGVLALGVLADRGKAAELKIFAAASLTDALKEISTGYEKATGDRVRFNLGASSFLERQIGEGAPADLFFSADEAKMDLLEAKGLIVKETRKSRLSNTLVIVVAKDSSLQVSSAAVLAEPRVRRVALADPKTVPAGIYARRYLELQGLWRQVEPKVVPTDNVRAALAAVESGNVEAGIVYATDAAISKNIKVACHIPAKDGPAISYPMAVVKESGQMRSAMRFWRHLDSEEAAQIFEKHGFIVRR